MCPEIEPSRLVHGRRNKHNCFRGYVGNSLHYLLVIAVMVMTYQLNCIVGLLPVFTSSNSLYYCLPVARVISHSLKERVESKNYGPENEDKED